MADHVVDRKKMASEIDEEICLSYAPMGIMRYHISQMWLHCF